MKKILYMAIFIVSMIILSGCNNKYDKDLSRIVELSFDMTMEDVIEYEEQENGNFSYDFDKENNRLDFVRFEYDSHYKHMYFFDEKTNTLEQITYRDGDSIIFDDDECIHIDIIVDRIIDQYGKWDKETDKGLFKYLYGNVDGERCKIKYDDSNARQAIFISAEDKDDN